MPENVTMKVLQKLPPGRPLCSERTTDMSGRPRDAVRWMWTETHPNGYREIRVANFCLYTGDYLGECQAGDSSEPIPRGAPAPDLH